MPAYPGASVIDGVPTAWYAIDHGLLSWTLDPAHASGTFTLATGGTVYLAQLKVVDRVVSNLVYQVTTAGATLTSGQCFAGLYQNGVLIGTSADQSGVWNSTGVKTTALVAPVTPLEGAVYAAFVFNGTTGPTLSSGATVAGVNAGIAATASRFGTANTGVTTALPATLGTVSALSASPFVAVS